MGSQFPLFVRCNFKPIIRYNVSDGIAVHRVVWVRIYVKFYRRLTLINNINLSNFCPPIYLTLKSLDGRNHRLGHLFEMKLDNKIIDL